MLRLSKMTAVALLAAATVAVGANAETAAQSEAKAVVLKADAALQKYHADPKYAARVAEALRIGRAVLIVPDYVRAGLGIGGAGGTGVLLQKEKEDWSASGFYTIRAANIGPQIGYQKGALVLVIANNDTLKDILNGEFTLSADAAVQAGDESGKADASTTTAFRDTGFVAFLRGQGAYAGATIGGAQISANAELNAATLTAADTERLRGTLARIAGPRAASK